MTHRGPVQPLPFCDSVVQPQGPRRKAAHPDLPTLLLHKRSGEPEEHHSAPICLPWVNSGCTCAGEQQGVGTLHVFSCRNGWILLLDWQHFFVLGY